MEKEKYIIIDGETSGEIIEDESISLVELTEDELVECLEQSWNREVQPNVIIPVSTILNILNNYAPKTFQELFPDAEN